MSTADTRPCLPFKKKIVLLLILSTSLVNSTFADELRCENVVAEGNDPFPQTQTYPEAFETIGRIRSWTSSLIHPPENVTDEPVRGVEDVTYAPLLNVLMLFELQKESAEDRPALIAHEWGHALFQFNVKFPDAMGSPVTPEAVEKNLHMWRQAALAWSKDDRERNKECYYPLVVKAAEMQEQLQQNFAVFKWHKELEGLTEFFADVVSVLEIGRGNAMASTNRDFTIEHTDWSYLTTVGDSHHFYDRARHYLWHKYLSKLAPINRGVALKAVLNAVTSEVARLAEISFKEDVLTSNEKLMEALDREFKGLF